MILIPTKMDMGMVLGWILIIGGGVHQSQEILGYLLSCLCWILTLSKKLDPQEITNIGETAHDTGYNYDGELH